MDGVPENVEKPNCAECRGACCETILVPVKTASPDTKRWIIMHMGVMIQPGLYEFPLPCTALRADGTCMVYETRPKPCKDYPVGGPDCLATIERRRKCET